MGASGSGHERRTFAPNGSGITRREALALAALGLIAGAPGRAGAADPQGS
jgi:hypothetical protein